MISKRTQILVYGALLQFSVGIIYIWSIFQTSAIEYFHWNLSASSYVFTIMFVINLIGCLIGGRMVERLGSRPVLIGGEILFISGILLTTFVPVQMPQLIYLTYSTLSGFGVGLVYNTVLCCVQKWWLDKKGLAGGVIVSAYGFSTVVFSPIANKLLESIGFIGTFRVLALFYILLFLVITGPMKDPAESSAAQKPASLRRTVQMNPQQMLQSLYFYIICLINIMISSPYLMLNPVFKAIGLTRGLTEALAVAAVMITGIASSSGRLLFAWLTDLISVQSIMIVLPCVSLICSALLTSAQGVLYILAIAGIALSYGGNTAMASILAVEYFGDEHLNTNFGFLMLSVMISGIVFPVAADLVSRADGLPSTMTFIVCISASAIALVFGLVLKKLTVR